MEDNRLVIYTITITVDGFFDITSVYREAADPDGVDEIKESLGDHLERAIRIEQLLPDPSLIYKESGKSNLH